MNEPLSAIRPQTALAPPAAPPQGGGDPGDAAEEDFQAFGKDGFTFYDFIDIINPLQHIPLVSTLYRNLTGDSIDPGSRIAGGTLFGGPIGAAVSFADVMIEENTGKDMGNHVLAFLGNGPEADESVPEPAIETAAGGPPPPLLSEAPLSPAPVTTGQTAWTQPPAPAAAGPEASGAEHISSNIEVLHWARQQAALQQGNTAPLHAAQPPSPSAPASEKAARPVAESPPQTKPPVSAPILAQQAEGPAPEPQTVAAAYRRNGTRAQQANAIAKDGGWFTEVMLSAMTKYQAGKADDISARGTALDTQN